MRKVVIPLFLFFLILSCTDKNKRKSADNSGSAEDSAAVEEPRLPVLTVDDIRIVKDLLYDKYTLEHTYPYRDTVREFQWEKIREKLLLVDSMQLRPASWGVLQNRMNKNGEAPLVTHYKRNSYTRIVDTFGVERYQSVPLYLSADSLAPERYGRDGTLVKVYKDTTEFITVEAVEFSGKWDVPRKYIKEIADTVVFRKAIFVDRLNQNIATLEKSDSVWYVRSVNPATTGVHRPPYAQETPLGMFVIQEKKAKMFFLKDGTNDMGGFASYASRFCNGAYIHGVPVNLPRTEPIEFSWTLGTTPRSHMCVRNATSHAKFVYDWAPLEATIVFVIE